MIETQLFLFIFMLEFAHVSLTLGGQRILQDIDVRIAAGEMVAFVGRSGAGKSSIFRLLNGTKKPTSGEIWLEGIPVHKLKGTRMQQYRAQIGMVFQDSQLLPHMTVAENVAFPLHMMGEAQGIASKVETALHAVGLFGSGHKMPQVLSGGEAQRVAIARALVHDPKLLIADEPTGNLDPETTQSIAELFRTLNTDLGLTVLFSTHDPAFIKTLRPRTLRLENGALVE